MRNSVFETSRTYLRPFDPDLDAEQIYKLNRDSHVMKYTGDDAFSSIDQARMFLSSYPDYSKNGYGRWSVVSKEDHDFFGWCGLKLHKDGMVDLGYRFHRIHWGKGLATETALASIKYGFDVLSLKEIIGRTARENTRSIRVFEKCGMKYYKSGICEGIPDSVFYKIQKKHK